jgi:hypothetical protein
MPLPTGQKLCVCTAQGCFSNEDVDPHTSRIVRGRYLPPSTWRRHRDVQQEADVEEQTEQLARMTLLRTIATTDSIAQQVKCIDSTPSGSAHPVTSQDDPSFDGPQIDSRALSRSADELRHLGKIIAQRTGTFTPPCDLQFASPPSPLVPYRSQFTTISHTNAGPFALNVRHATSDALVRFERSLLQMLEALQDVDCIGDKSLSAKKKELVEKVHQSLRQIDSVKESEWNRQYRRREPIAHGLMHEPIEVNTGERHLLDNIKVMPDDCVIQRPLSFKESAA